MSRQATLPFVPTLPFPSQADPAVEAWLRRALLRREPIALGMDGTDPYSVEALSVANLKTGAKTPPGFVRSLLQSLTRLDGLEIAITTRSPRVLQDLSLLTELDQRHTVRVDIPLPSVDRDLVRQIEPREPEPEARLWTISQLAAEGIATRVLVKPLLPEGGAGGSDGRDGDNALRALFEAALTSGACDVVEDPIPAARPRRLWDVWDISWAVSWSTRGAQANKKDRASEAWLATIHRLRLEHGFPRSTPGRG